MRGAGCTWNDIADRDLDGAVERTRQRPLPLGQVTVRQALIWMAVQALLAAVILFSYNRLAIALGLGSLVLVAIYPFAKRFTWWPQLFLGLAFNWGVLLAYAAHSGTVSVPAVLMYASGIVWTLFYDTIYALQDKEDDAMIGIKSTARLFGAQTGIWLSRFLIAATLLMTVAVIMALVDTGRTAAMVIALAGVWGFGWHLSWQQNRLNPEDPTSCLRVFRSNREAGLIPALFLAVAAVV